MKQLILITVVVSIVAGQTITIFPWQFDQLVSVSSAQQIQQNLNTIISSDLSCDQKYFSVFCLLAKVEDADEDGSALSLADIKFRFTLEESESN